MKLKGGLLRRGSRGPSVRILQEMLNELGFDTNGVDGSFGGGTKEAVEAFQDAHGLTCDGMVGRNTASAINAAYADEDDYEEDELFMVGDRELVDGDEGEDVEQLQNMLSDLDYPMDEIDGIFGAYTTEAVMAFQNDHGLDPTGIVDSETSDALYAAIDEVYS